MRDTRFIAEHRGGPLSKVHHQQLAAWAADCAERVWGRCESQTDDARPRQAIEVARAWARGEVRVGACQQAAVAAHAAARAATAPHAVVAARAAGHAAATAHAADHSLATVHYALKAVPADSQQDELSWQLQALPAELRALVSSALALRKIGPRAAP